VNRGKLLAFEGVDGCGKSTQVERCAGALRAAGHELIVTREPTDGPHGRRIRAMVESGQPVDRERELHWFVEDRRSHVAEVIEPALEAGRLVLTDRYYLSTVAYQGARGLDPLQILEQSEAEFPVPDLVLLLEIEAPLGLERVRDRGRAVETVFERREFLERVAGIFRSIDRPYIERVDAHRGVEDVHREIVERVRERLGLF
jgi:dTMP kinase